MEGLELEFKDGEHIRIRCNAQPEDALKFYEAMDFEVLKVQKVFYKKFVK